MTSEKLELAPLRRLDDFLLGSAQFQIPNVNDFEKWGNRVANNLLYYQTNYFLTAFVVFLLVGFCNPVKFIYGMIAIGIAFGLFCYVTNAKRSASQFKKNHPIIGVFLILTGGYIIVYLLGSVLVFLFGILLPIALIFVHSSMRLRNIKNKIANKIEIVGLKRTPMGIFLESLGQRSYPSDESPKPKTFLQEKTVLGLYDLKGKNTVTR